MLKLLREWHSVFSRGLTYYCMKTYDDTRQYDELAVYELLLSRLEWEGMPELEQTEPYDPVVPYYV